MKIVKYDRNPWASILKCFLKIRVHVTGNSLNMTHPFNTRMINKIVYDLFLLASGNPKNMAGFQIDDMGGVFMAVMKLEFIDSQISTAGIGFLQHWSEFRLIRIKPAQPGFINLANEMSSDTSPLSDFLQGIAAACQQIFNVRFESCSNRMLLCSEWNRSHLCMMAVLAEEALNLHGDMDISKAKGKVAQCD